MNKFFLSMLYVSIALLTFSSCSDDDDDGGGAWTGPTVTDGAFVLNTGNFGANDAILSYLDLESGTITPDVFGKTNDKKKLGAGGQDVVVYGSKLYVTVTESNVIYILDRNGKMVADSITPLNASGQPLNPRSLVAYNGNVYVSMYGGYVGRIDTISLKMNAKVEVGAYPEKMTVANGNLYVATSSYYPSVSNSISIIDIAEFKTSQDKEVGLNPNEVVADAAGNLYVACWGDYGDIKSMVKRVDYKTGEVTDVATGNHIAIDGAKLYIVYTSYEDDKWPVYNDIKMSWYDVDKKDLHDESFIKATGDVAKALNDAQSFAIDPVNKTFYFLTATYGSNGDLYTFSSAGSFLKKQDTGGAYPIKVEFLTK